MKSIFGYFRERQLW